MEVGIELVRVEVSLETHLRLELDVGELARYDNEEICMLKLIDI